MKRAVVLALAVMLSGCIEHTEFGACVGIVDDRDPTKQYKLSVQNAVMAVLFFELIVPPVVVVANELFCPVGEKAAAK